MKTFSQFMEQILTSPQAKVDAAKIKANTLITRQHNRLANLDRLHKTMHLRDTAKQEQENMNR